MTDFAPTILGDSLGAAGDTVVEVDADDEDEGNAGSDGTAQIWVIDDGADIELRVAGIAHGNAAADVDWFNPAHVTQGAPDTDRIPGTTVFQLGERTGVTVNIFTVERATGDGLTVTKIGTFTDDDKSTFFALTQDVDYGWSYRGDADDPPGLGEVTSLVENQDIQFTFRKAGFNDFTITMSENLTVFATDTT